MVLPLLQGPADQDVLAEALVVAAIVAVAQERPQMAQQLNAHRLL